MCKYAHSTISLFKSDPVISFSGIEDCPVELLPEMDDVNLAPYKYNGGQLYIPEENDRKYCINVDWFEVTLKGNSFLKYDEYGEPESVMSFDYGEVFLERDQERVGGTKHYKYVFKVYLHGELFGHLLTVPRNSAILDEGLSQFRIENHYLYVRGWTERFSHVINSLEITVNNFTRIDIALDGHGFFDFHNAFEKGFFEKLGRASYENFYTGKQRLTGFEIGKKSSSKCLTCYNRSQRIKADNKTYLQSYWKKNGIDISEEVERLELKLRAKSIKQIEAFEFFRLEDSEYLAAIMKMQLRNFYEFTEINLDSNVSRRERIHPVDWDLITSEKIEKTKEVKPPNVIWSVKMAIRFSMQEYFADEDSGVTNLFNQVRTRNFGLAKKYGVLDWYERRMRYWKKQKDFHDAIKERRRHVNFQYQSMIL